MKNLALASAILLIGIFISVPVNAQKNMNNYTTDWKKVEDFQNKGLSKSALAQVNSIYVAARREGNDAQTIKALLFKLTLQQNLEENAGLKGIDSLQTEISNAKEPAKSILQSITAQLYWNYFQQNRYKLYQRTNTVNFDKKDIATWTADDLHKKIAELYLASLKNKTLLQQTSLAPFDAIINKGNTRNLRPSLFDLLAHRALDYFNNNERDISRPAYSFEINNKAAFGTAPVFIKEKFTTKDTSSLHHKALLIYQQLLAFHEDDKNTDAYIDVDIERLNFVHEYSVATDKDELYLDALKNLAKKFESNPASAQAAFLAAQLIYNRAFELNIHKKQDQVYSISNAKILLDEIVKKHPESEGGINAQNLIITILRPRLNVTVEKVNVPGTPFRALVEYKNVNTIWLRILALTPELKKQITEKYNNEDLFQNLKKQPAINSWSQPLPPMKDYLEHSVELKINALPVGEFVVLASGNENFSLDKNPLEAQYFYVSTISFINSGLNYFLLDRTSGQPLQGARVNVWIQKYSYEARKNILVRGESLTTDKRGYFRLNDSLANRGGQSIRLDINYKDDHLFMDDNDYVYYNEYNSSSSEKYENQEDADSDNAKVFLFTDRSIYRPGQVIYFKGIGVTIDFKTKKSILLQAKKSFRVIFSDANGDKIDSLNVAFNDFGSFNGKFKIPENKLNGEFSIEVNEFDNSSVSFSVEEYKRPKFYTEFEKAKESYRVNDTVKISGFAKAFAGNNIDGASVSYRVTRIARFLYPWRFWRSPYPVVQPLEIAHGQITTDADGRFSVSFVAMPDLTLDAATDPVFDYKIEADVTDLNGETRSGEIVVPVGYKTLNLQINLPDGNVVEKESIKNIVVSSENLSGEPQRVKAAVKIFRLKNPERLIRQRLWAAPDQFVYTKEEFLKYFPQDEYKEETKKESWEREAAVFEKSDSVLKNSPFALLSTTFKAGWYVVEATAMDQYGQLVKDVKYFQVYDKKSSSPPSPDYVWNHIDKNILQPGETAHIITGSSAKNIYLIQQTERMNDGVAEDSKSANTVYEYAALNENMKNIDIPIVERDRGGFGINSFFVKDNRFFVVFNQVNVPWKNKELNISFDTYRDKTLPGSEEKWKIKITGNKGEKVAAEMLASMYDASLDQFRPHSWRSLSGLWPTYSGYNNWQGRLNFTTVTSFQKYWSDKYVAQKEKSYDALIYLPFYGYNIMLRGYATMRAKTPLPASAEVDKSAGNLEEVVVSAMGVAKKEESIGYAVSDSTVANNQAEVPARIDPSQIQIRKNFNETVFFYPELRTDENGGVEFSFTMPEALTKWKLMALAHTKDLASGYAEHLVVTQKELMVQPNAPRFLREGDKLEFSAKIVNLSDKEVSGQAELQLLNATTMNPIDGWFKNNKPVINFSAAAGQSTLVNFAISVPVNFNNAVVYRIIAKAGNVSDGEEAAIPVVTNRMLVTESMPLPMRGEGSKEFEFKKLKNSGKSETLTNYGFTVEYTTNPAWYAVQALPYLMEYPYECAEQTFNRFYANALAQKIVNSSPRIKAIFEKWKTIDTAALISNLAKNEELKSVLLQETPWVLNAQSETQQKKNIALLFDMVKMSLQAESAVNKLKEMQSPNGGFVWFKGGPDNRYITQYILAGIGHLKKLNAIPAAQESALKNMVDKAIPYLDVRLNEDYNNLKKYKSVLKNNNLSALAVQHLYMRSFFPEYPIAKASQTAYSYYREQSKKYWLSQSKYLQGMIALASKRNNETLVANAIIKSLKENSINNTEMGMYWKEWDRHGYWWYESPIESQALLIEAFTEIENDQKTIGDLKTWLLKNKQTNRWQTTKATADACYALLLQGNDWLAADVNVSIKTGDVIISNKDEKEEAGTGYFKRSIAGDKVKPEMGNIKVTIENANKSAKNNEKMPSWGAAYWQYFENMDKITFAETPLKLSKKLFIEKNTDRGPVLIPVNDGDNLHVGDKIKVRIELRADRDMEYVHMKDMRASCMEPTNVISQYKWQGGLGYYESTKDVSTNFFFGYLNKGTYVFEYPMFVTHSGNFSNGITTIQCMYAPEFTAHSEGVRVNVLPVSNAK